MVFYESPRRLAETLAAMAQIWGERPAAVALELTKRFERVHRGNLVELAQAFSGEETKGEAVIVVGGAPEAGMVDDADWQSELAAAMADQPLRAAVDATTAKFGLKRRDVYDAALRLKNGE
jgi:16S rRNA (cytidine1402-2'-O)-methyltransferase